MIYFIIRNIKLLLLFIFFSSTLIYSQKNFDDITDTIETVTFKEFKVPSEKNIVVTNVLSADVSAIVYSETGAKIGDVERLWRDKSKEYMRKTTRGGRGETVQFYAIDKIDKAGNYYLSIEINYVDEYNRNQSATLNYLIIIENPSRPSDVEISNSTEYYYGEKKSFSFNTAEFNKVDAYSYTIEDNAGNLVDSSKGPIVMLDDVLNNTNNAGKELTIKGFYEDKQFYYTVNGENEPKISEWSFSVKVPNLEFFGLLADKENEDDLAKNAPFYYGSPKSTQILFTFIQKTASGGYIIERPDFRNARVSATPSGILKKNWNFSKRGVFAYFTFQIDENWVNNNFGGECQQEYIELNISFVDQFNRKREFNFDGYVLN